MNYNLKAVYFCYTNNGRWGKGKTISDAKKNANAKNCTEYFLYACLFDSDDLSEEVFDNLYSCIVGNGISGSPMFYESNRTQEDTDMITKHHVGWLKVEHYIKSKSK